MTREQIEAEVFRMVKEDIEATDDEIRDAIDVTSDNELRAFYRRLKRIRSITE